MRFILAFLMMFVPIAALAHEAAAPHPTPEDLDPSRTDTYLKEIEAQLKGRYSEIKDFSPPVNMIQRAWDKSKPTAGTRFIPWYAGYTAKVIVREGMGTTIKLPSWESVNAFILGDVLLWNVETLGTDKNILDIRSRAVGVDTGLRVIGRSGNVYNFYLRAEGVNSKQIPDVLIEIEAGMPSSYRTQENIPPQKIERESVQTFLEKSEPEWLRSIDFDPTKVRHDVTVRGDSDLAPVVIFRDDRFTYFDYGIAHKDQVWGAVYEVIDNVDSPVANIRKSKDGRYLIVESIRPLTVKYGKKVLCVKRSS